MRKAALFILLLGLSAVMTQACVSEVKPVLRQSELNIDEKIARQQKQLDSGIATGHIQSEEARAFQENLDKIKKRYATLKSKGKLTPKDEKDIRKMLDQNGDKMFSEKPARKRPEKKKDAE
ncbi:MAG: hypothetical protein AAGU11_17670 [Syntrophobacteraceae bacterium]